MKKCLTLLLTLSLIFALSAAAMAGAMGVNVNEGYSVDIEKPNCSVGSYSVTGNFGISDNVLFWLCYATESDADNALATTSLGGRFEIIENLAATFSYATNDDSNEWTLGIRGKAPINDVFALTGKIEYINTDPDTGDDFTAYLLFGQAEYAFSKYVTGNLGAKYYYNNDAESSTTYYLAGLEIYPTAKTTLWLDYTKDNNDSDAVYGLGVEFAF